MKSSFQLIACLMLSLIASPSWAAPYYAGKTIRIVIGFTPGGGNDLFARIFPRFLSQTIEGNPNVLVENRPGAGGVAALNWFAEAAPRDGTVLMVVSGNLVARMALGTSDVTAKVSDIRPIMTTPIGRTNYIYAGTGYKTPKDILTLQTPLFLGSTDPLSTIGSVVGLTLIKAPFKTVKGYPGKADALLSLERGETTVGDIATPIFNENVMPVVREGKVLPLYTHGMMDGDKLVRDPANTDLPTIQEFYREVYGTDPSGPAWEAYKTVIRAIGNSGKNMMMHKDTPAAAVEALKSGFGALLNDAEFLKGAEATLEGYSLAFGDKLTQDIIAISNMDPGSKAWLQELYGRDYVMKFR